MASEISGCAACMRGLLLVLNIIFLLVGIALLGIGIYIKVDTNFASALSDLAGETDFSAQSIGFLGYMMIIAGVITILIAFFGCVGTLWLNRCLLWTYAIILLTLMILELTGCIMAIVYKNKLHEVYDDTLSKVLRDGLTKQDDKIITAFQSLEEAVSCCGAHGISDYATYLPFEKLSKPCQKGNDTMGCADKIVDLLNKNLPIVSGTLGGILALELITLIGAIALAVALKNVPKGDYSSSPGEVLRYAVPGRRRNY